jgi:hypothetical protein
MLACARRDAQSLCRRTTLTRFRCVIDHSDFSLNKLPPEVLRRSVFLFFPLQIGEREGKELWLSFEQHLPRRSGPEDLNAQVAGRLALGLLARTNKEIPVGCRRCTSVGLGADQPDLANRRICLEFGNDLSIRSGSGSLMFARLAMSESESRRLT